MEIQYDYVPDIITGKDLDYLSDMFNWNYGALKNTNDAISHVSDKEISDCLEKGCKLFENNLRIILDILNEGGSYEQ